jgi:PAS domain S-box-containing protein
MLDPEGLVASWNSGAERVTGFTAVDILGQPGACLFTPEDRAAGIPEQEIERAAATGAALDERWHMRRDGTRFWASGVMTAAREGGGPLRGFVKVMRDQTERKETDSRLQEALQSAQQLRATAEHANRVKDEFISTVSHELRTPLNTIRLWSRMFISGKVHDEEVIKGGQMIDRAALAQQQLIDDLLDVSRMSTGHLRLNLRDTALLDTAMAAIEAVRPLAASRGLSLDVDLSPDVGTVCLDPDRIQQVLWNVLANAVKFSNDGGRILVRMRRENGTVEIAITDFGMGIRAEFLPHVFDRFRQAQSGSNRRFGGLGLGLAIAKQLVELHGGTMTAYSEGEGTGATFTLYLPLERTHLAADRGQQSSLPPPESNDLRGVEMLLVEDETLSREATKRLLEYWGAEVRTVQSARQAREAFMLSRPGVIMADIGMPDEDGYSLLEGLRRLEAEEGTPRVPAIAVTAFARSEDRERALAAGFDVHVAKPVDPERLLQALAKLVVRPAPPR